MDGWDCYWRVLFTGWPNQNKLRPHCTIGREIGGRFRPFRSRSLQIIFPGCQMSEVVPSQGDSGNYGFQGGAGSGKVLLTQKK